MGLISYYTFKKRILPALGHLLSIYILLMALHTLNRRKTLNLEYQYLALLWTVYHLKRMLEILFVHIYYSPEPEFYEIFLEYTYYWGFAMIISQGIEFITFPPPVPPPESPDLSNASANILNLNTTSNCTDCWINMNSEEDFTLIDLIILLHGMMMQKFEEWGQIEFYEIKIRDWRVFILCIIFILCLLGSVYSHLILRSLRKDCEKERKEKEKEKSIRAKEEKKKREKEEEGLDKEEKHKREKKRKEEESEKETKEREQLRIKGLRIPKAFLYEFISCPHYLFEVSAF
jgi:hypothetical protein